MDHQDDHFFKETQGFSNVISPPEDSQTNYYNEYCRLYLANFVLTSQMRQIIKEKRDLEERLYTLEDRQYEYDNSQTVDKNKRNRRNANQIHRFHKCTVEGCNKSYGSEGSLNQHMKLKHHELLGQQELESSIHHSKIQQQNININSQKNTKKKK